MGANPHANGGLLLRRSGHAGFSRLRRERVQARNRDWRKATRVLGKILRDVMKLNAESKNFRVFGPDETASNRLEALYEVTDKVFMEPTLPTDEAPFDRRAA